MICISNLYRAYLLIGDLSAEFFDWKSYAFSTIEQFGATKIGYVLIFMLLIMLVTLVILIGLYFSYLKYKLEREKLEKHLGMDLESDITDFLANRYKKNKEPYIAKHAEPMDNFVDPAVKESMIYIVENNDEMRTGLQNTLGKYFKISGFRNVKDCIEAIESKWPDLIVSDIFMPEMGGIQLCEHVKLDIGTSHIPVVFLTAHDTMENKLRGLEVGADAYISKPFLMKHLIMRIVMLLKNRKALKERFHNDFHCSSVEKSDNEHDKLFVNRLLEVMSENYEDPEFTPDRFSQEMYISRSHFFQKVKMLTDQTPCELLKSYRLKKAAELLKQEKLPIAEVSVRMGFKNEAYFSRIFKSKYNVPPSKYAG